MSTSTDRAALPGLPEEGEERRGGRGRWVGYSIALIPRLVGYTPPGREGVCLTLDARLRTIPSKPHLQLQVTELSNAQANLYARGVHSANTQSTITEGKVTLLQHNLFLLFCISSKSHRMLELCQPGTPATSAFHSNYAEWCLVDERRTRFYVCT
jgi:hypothetical protein